MILRLRLPLLTAMAKKVSPVQWAPRARTTSAAILTRSRAAEVSDKTCQHTTHLVPLLAMTSFATSRRRDPLSKCLLQANIECLRPLINRPSPNFAAKAFLMNFQLGNDIALPWQAYSHAAVQVALQQEAVLGINATAHDMLMTGGRVPNMP